MVVAAVPPEPGPLAIGLWFLLFTQCKRQDEMRKFFYKVVLDIFEDQLRGPLSFYESLRFGTFRRSLVLLFLSSKMRIRSLLPQYMIGNFRGPANMRCLSTDFETTIIWRYAWWRSPPMQ